MSDETAKLNNEQATIADPLDENLNDVDLSYPLLPAALYDFMIKDVTRKSNKAGTGEILEIKLATVNTEVSTKGVEQSPGLVLTHRIGITPHEADAYYGKEYTIEQIKRSLASLARGAGVTCTARELLNNPAMLKGCQVRAKVSIRKETEEFPESNEVRGFVILQ